MHGDNYATSGSIRSEQSSTLTSHQPHSLSLGTWRAGFRDTIRRMKVVTFCLNSSVIASAAICFSGGTG